MKTPNPEKERSEKALTIEEFLVAYNTDLPETFPPASLQLLEEFKETCPSFFKHKEYWTLDQHRKKVIDWLQQRVGSERG